MSANTDKIGHFVRTELSAQKPPPKSEVGIWHWIRTQLFSTLVNAVVTLLCIWIIYEVVVAVYYWAIHTAVWSGEDGSVCRGGGIGACWPFIADKISLFIYGFYPEAEKWRINLCFLIGAVGLVPLMMPKVPFKKVNAIFILVIYPIIVYFLLSGGSFGLETVRTSEWGGLTVTLVVAVTGIVASLPLGVLLALGRRSEMPIVRLVSVIFIEFWRGVPLITVLFMSSVMLPFLLPHEVEFDKLLRVLIFVTFFSAAYIAEVVRGGLQAIPKGQYEGGKALGLGYWKIMIFIILPQALKHVIPGIVNSFIALFKDTTLLSIVGIYDLLSIMTLQAFNDPDWKSPAMGYTGYAFLAMVYWVFCFAMSRYSIFLEKLLHTGHKR